MEIDQPPPAPTISYLIIDPATLKIETVASLVKEFVLREQANDAAFDLDEAVVKAQTLIKKGSLLITFDPLTESVGIIDSRDPALLNI